MTRAIRIDVQNNFYHVMNRSNFKLDIFNNDSDYFEFLKIIKETLEVAPIKIYAYCIMPNHWHFLISPYENGGVAKFMHALTNKHTRRVHVKTDTVGYGPLYQGRYKSIVIDTDISFMRVFRYIERNAARANLVETPSGWKWCSAWIRENGNIRHKTMLEKIPEGILSDYGNVSDYVNTIDDIDDIKKIRSCIAKGTPYGRERWVDKMINDYGLGSTVRKVGRPNKW